MKRRFLYVLFTFIFISTWVRGNHLVVSGGEGYPLIFPGTGMKNIRVSVHLDTLSSGVELYAIVKKARSGEVIGEKLVKLDTGLHHDLPIDFEFPQWGYYRYEVQLRDIIKGTVIDSVSTSIAIVPERQEIGPSDFGTCTHFGHFKGSVPYGLDLIRLAGFSSIRDEIFWDRIEQKPGVFSFDPRYDRYVDAAVERDIRVLMILDYGNPLPGEKTAHGFPLDDSGRKRFARYAEEMVTRYKDKIFLWELWNEPSKALGIDPGTSYFELLKEVYPVIKAVQPQGEFICSGGAPNLVDGAYVNPIFKRGGASFMDGFAMHTYVAPYGPEDGYETKGHPFLKNVSVPSLWPHYGKMAEQQSDGKNKQLDVWITEMGWHLADSLPTSKGESLFIDEYRQAAYITRLFLLARRYHTTKCVYLYDFQNDGVDLKEKEHNFGIIRKDFSPKAAYPAVAVLSHLLAEKKFTRALQETTDTKVFCYGEGKEEVIALWSVNRYWEPLESHSKTISLDIGRKKIGLIDWQGQKTVMESVTGKYTLPISENPSFIVYE